MRAATAPHGRPRQTATGYNLAKGTTTVNLDERGHRHAVVAPGPRRSSPTGQPRADATRRRRNSVSSATAFRPRSIRLAPAGRCRVGGTRRAGSGPQGGVQCAVCGEAQPDRWCSSIPLPQGSLVNACWRPVVPTGDRVGHLQAAGAQLGHRRVEVVEDQGEVLADVLRDRPPRSGGPAGRWPCRARPRGSRSRAGCGSAPGPASRCRRRSPPGTSGTLMATWSTPAGATRIAHGSEPTTWRTMAATAGVAAAPTAAIAADSLVGWPADAAGLVTSGQAEDVDAGLAGGDRLERHATCRRRRRPCLEHADLGRRLELGPQQLRVDARPVGQGGGRRRGRGGQGQGAQAGRVGVDHVDEGRAAQRAAPGQVELVLDHHDGARRRGHRGSRPRRR